MLNSTRQQFDQSKGKADKCMGYFYNNYNMEKNSKCISVPMGVIFLSQCTLNNRMHTLFSCTVLNRSLCRLVCHKVAVVNGGESIKPDPKNTSTCWLISSIQRILMLTV